MFTSPTPCSKPVPSNPPLQPSDQDGTEFLSVGSNQFNIASLAALYNSAFAQGFSNDEHNVHLDGTHYHSRTKGGLHPTYVGFNPSMNNKKVQTLSNKELAEAFLQDMFDAVS